MLKTTGIMLLTGSYIIMIMVMIILPFIIPDHSIAANTVDELGAQYAPYAWIFNLTIICLATGAVITGWSYYEGYAFHRSILAISGISLVFSALLNHAPSDTQISYNVIESGLHEYFSCSAVLSFTILSIATGFIQERQNNKLLASISGLSATILLIMTSESDHMAGIWSRLLLIIAFGWLISSFNTNEI